MVLRTTAGVRRDVRRVVAAALGFPAEDVSHGARLHEDLWLDHYDALELVEVVEDAFGISIPDTTVDRLRTVADLERQVEQSGRRAL